MITSITDPATDMILGMDFDDDGVMDVEFNDGGGLEFNASLRESMYGLLEDFFSSTDPDIQELFGQIILSPYPLVILPTNGPSYTPASGGFTVKINPSYTSAYVGEDGIVRPYSAFKTMIHEIIHAVQDEHDPNYEDGSLDLANPDYLGGAEETVNAMYDEIVGFVPAPSYLARGEFWTVFEDQDLTNISSVLPWSGNNATLGNAAWDIFLDMSLNTTLDSLNDLLMGDADDENIFGGMGIDYLYGGAGSDQLYGGVSHDYLNGGSGRDVAHYEVMSSIIGDTSESRVVLSIGEEVRIIDSSGGEDILVDIEEIILTAYDDIVLVTDLSVSAEVVDGGEQEADGDTIFVESDESGYIIDLFENSLSDGTVIVDVLNFENAIGSGFDDVIIGSEVTNRLEGGAGTDSIYGGAANDIIVFDSLDMNDGDVDGGSGFDIGIFEGPGTANVDTDASSLEVIISGIEGDSFNSGGLTTTLISGGDGNDTFTIDSKGNSPTVVWGGDGNDHVTIVTPSPDYPEGVGILIVQADNLTEENFEFFNIEDLGLGSSFDWSQIDVVLVNPDEGDTVSFGTSGNQQIIEVDEGQLPVVRYIPLPGDGENPNELVPETYGQIPGLAFEGQLVDDYESEFLNGYSGTVFAPQDNISYFTVTEYKDELGDPFVSGLSAGSEYPPELGLLGSGWDGEVDRDYDLSSADFVSDWTTIDGSYGSREHYFYYVEDKPLEEPPLWFIVGGEVDGSVFSGSTITYTVPDSENEEILSRGGGGSEPRGGSYTSGGGATNLNGHEGVSRLTAFDPLLDSVVLNGEALRVSDLPDDITVSESDGSTIIRYGIDDYVVLRGVALDDWESGSATHINGTAGSNTISGTSAADVIAAGGGNDTISAGAGDDRINYTSGDDLILGATNNSGNDTLDLRRFSSADISFTIGAIDPLLIQGADVLVITPDGVITLDAQLLNDLGHSQSNIEEILFDDGPMDEATIRSRAVLDQASEGDDLIVATAFADLVYGGDGNDTLFGGDGNDELYGGDGADTLTGGDGDDVYFIENSSDDGVEGASKGTDSVVSSVNVTLASNIENLFLIETALSGTGNALANSISGNELGNHLQGLDGNDMLEGHAGIDSIYGGSGNDTLIGGANNDTLDGGSGNDTMLGGDGDDTYLVSSLNDVLDESTGSGIDLVRAAVTWTLADGFENLTQTSANALSGTGNAAANILTGNTAANTLAGLNGNDTIFGGGGNDVLIGGDGDDFLDGDAGNDSLSGGTGNDTYVIDNLADSISEALGGGIDTVQSAVVWTLASDFEHLTLLGTGAVDGMGNALSNAIVGTNGINVLAGLDGDDSLYGYGGDDTLDGGIGNDSLYGDTGNDVLMGGTGNDLLDGGVGTDTLTGGSGDDIYVVNSATDVVTEASGGGNDTVYASRTTTLYSEVENLVLTSTSNFNGIGTSVGNAMSGNSGDNYLQGLGGDDTLYGGAGNDRLDGGTGNDTLTGGDGDDVYTVDNASDTVIEASGEGVDRIESSATWTLASGGHVENLTLTGTGAINGTGNSSANTIIGNNVANSLFGGAGNDAMQGGAGNDTITGGADADHFVFTTSNNGTDTIVDFNELDGGSAEGDILAFQGLLVGSFAYMGSSAFSGGSDNSEARVSGSQLLIDSDGNGATNITINMTGLSSASQLDAGDFLWT